MSVSCPFKANCIGWSYQMTTNKHDDNSCDIQRKRFMAFRKGCPKQQVIFQSQSQSQPQRPSYYEILHNMGKCLQHKNKLQTLTCWYKVGSIVQFFCIILKNFSRNPWHAKLQEWSPMEPDDDRINSHTKNRNYCEMPIILSSVIYAKVQWA